MTSTCSETLFQAEIMHSPPAADLTLPRCLFVPLVLLRSWWLFQQQQQLWCVSQYFSPSAPEGSTWHTAGHRCKHSLLMPAFHQDPRCQRKSSRACQRNACLLSITVFLKKKTVIARFYLTIQSLYLTIWTFTFQFMKKKNHNCKLPRSSEFISRHCDLFR